MGKLAYHLLTLSFATKYKKTLITFFALCVWVKSHRYLKIPIKNSDKEIILYILFFYLNLSTIGCKLSDMQEGHILYSILNCIFPKKLSASTSVITKSSRINSYWATIPNNGPPATPGDDRSSHLQIPLPLPRSPQKPTLNKKSSNLKIIRKITIKGISKVNDILLRCLFIYFIL